MRREEARAGREGRRAFFLPRIVSRTQNKEGRGGERQLPKAFKGKGEGGKQQGKTRAKRGIVGARPSKRRTESIKAEGKRGTPKGSGGHIAAGEDSASELSEELPSASASNGRGRRYFCPRITSCAHVEDRTHTRGWSHTPRGGTNNNCACGYIQIAKVT